MIHTIRRAPRHTLDELAHLDAPGQLLVTDFHIDGAEAWHRVPWGLEHPGGRTVCIDHHAPIPEMQRQVTSTMLAVERVRGAGLPDPGRDVVVVNHTDCDAVLAAGLLSGRLDAADPAFAEASLAADHRGVPHPIADLLQGMDARWQGWKRPVADPEALAWAFDNLERLLGGRPLEDEARAAREERLRSRERAEAVVRSGAFEPEGGVWLARLDEPLAGELFLPFLPDAVIVLTASPHPREPGRWQVRLRLGSSALEGLSLHDLRIPDFDEGYGGRWNAGSNKRDGGTDLAPERYRAYLAKALGKVGSERRG